MTTVNTTTITGFIVLPNDTIRERSSVIFTMTGFDTDADDNATVVSVPVEAQIGSDGAISIDLWPNPEGVRTTFYRVTFSIYNGIKPILVDGGLIEVPITGGPYDLNDLLPIAPPSGATVDEYIAQLAAAVTAAGASATSAENALNAIETIGLNRDELVRNIPYLDSIVDSTLYSSFPVLATIPGRIGVLYHRGRNHGQSDDEAVCLPQTASGAGNLTINGNEASGGSVSVPAETQVRITSTGDDTGVTFTITGSLNGSPVTIVSPGANAGTINVTGLIDSISQVAVSGATAGNVSIGLLRLPSDIIFKYSDDGGFTWSSGFAVGDGQTAGLYRYYYPTLGVTRTGEFIALYQQVDITTGAFSPKYRTSADGVTWSAEMDMLVTGATTTTFALYGQIKTTPSGRLVASGYLGVDNYIFISDDDGQNWNSVITRVESGFTHSEAATAIVDEQRWIQLIRIDNANGTLVQVKTEDGGLTWTDQGQMNMPVSGGYKSHDVQVVTINGARHFVLACMARNAGTQPPNPGTIFARWGRVEDVFDDATTWFDYEETLVSGLATFPRDGYPSLYLHPNGEALMAFHEESGVRTSTVRTEAIALDEVIRGAEQWESWTPIIEGTSGGSQPSYSAQSGRFVRDGRKVKATFNVVVSGAISVSGTLRVGGLPFTIDAPVPDIGSPARLVNKVVAVDAPFVQAVNNTSQLEIRHQTSTSNSPVVSTEVTNNFQIIGTCEFFAK